MQTLIYITNEYTGVYQYTSMWLPLVSVANINLPSSFVLKPVNKCQTVLANNNAILSNCNCPWIVGIVFFDWGKPERAPH